MGEVLDPPEGIERRLKLAVAGAGEAFEALVHPSLVAMRNPQHHPSLKIGAPCPARIPDRRQFRGVNFEEWPSPGSQLAWNSRPEELGNGIGNTAPSRR